MSNVGSATERTSPRKWAKEGERPDIKWLPAGKLEASFDFQRERLRVGLVDKIAMRWDWNAVGALVVSPIRGTDRYNIDDGHHRWAAAQKRGIRELPCVITRAETDEEQARTFLTITVGRKPVDAVTKYLASLQAGDPTATEIDAWVRSKGLRISRNNDSSDSISFIAQLIDTWNWDAPSARLAVLAQRVIIKPGECLHRDIHVGMYILLRHGIPVDQETGKIIELGGRARLLSEINRVKAALSSVTSRRACALGVLNLINYRRRTRYQIDSEEAGRD